MDRGRDPVGAAANKHIAELEAIGIARPGDGTTDLLNRVSARRLTTEDSIEVLRRRFQAARSNSWLIGWQGRIFVGLGSDHTPTARSRPTRVNRVEADVRQGDWRPVLWELEDGPSVHWDQMIPAFVLPGSGGQARAVTRRARLDAMLSVSELIAQGFEGRKIARWLRHGSAAPSPQRAESGPPAALNSNLRTPFLKRSIHPRL